MDWLKKEQLKIDLVLISGDIANIPPEQYHTDSKELLKEHHDNLLRIVVDFVSVAEKVYFIPGNVCILSVVISISWCGDVLYVMMSFVERFPIPCGEVLYAFVSLMDI